MTKYTLRFKMKCLLLHLYCVLSRCGNKMSARLDRYMQCYQPEQCLCACKAFNFFFPESQFKGGN